jgi:hypothetical protein
MDFIDWSSLVVRKLIEASQTDSNAWHMGVSIDVLSDEFFNTSLYKLAGTKEGQAIVDATWELEQIGLIAPKNKDRKWLEVTRRGQELAEDMTAFWEQICSKKLKQEQAELLIAINDLSEQIAPNYSWLEYPTCADILCKVGWSDKDRIWSVAKPLETQLGFLAAYPFMDSDIGFRATYKGLVWTSRRGLTLESKRIDVLIKEWETTSVDFKRQLSIDTADQKAEFVKDILGLVNTQASGPRLLIIGFDDKTRAYHGPPNPSLSQNRVEQLLGRLTSPMVDVKYQIIDFRAGLVGQIEVLRDPNKLPYRVAEREGSKGSGGKRLIEKDQVFVRHGSQTEEPTLDELNSIIEEGNRARSSP